MKGLLRPSSEIASTNVPDEINAFRKAFDELLEKAGVEQLVVLIDDLDRCLPDTAIETLEAVRLFVFTSRTAFVVAADEAMIEYAVRRHFPDLPDTTGPQSYARKLPGEANPGAVSHTGLGRHGDAHLRHALASGALSLETMTRRFNRLICVARERLKRPWTSGALDAVTVKAALGDKAARANNAMALSDQIGPILASGTKGNPRQIKRFLNTLVLRQHTAEARGFGDDVRLPVLAKLMLAERFLPRLFDQIAAAAAAAPDGKCPDLSALEAVATGRECEKGAAKQTRLAAGRGDGAAKVPPKAVASKPTSSALLEEWLSSHAIKAWAAVPTEIGDDDLRPYLFVAKDRKDYFGASSVLGHLATVVEQLSGGKFAVQGLEGELKRLAPPEAAHVFEAVRGRIVGGDTFDTEPPGAVGLAVLIKAHPALQGNLVDLLESLPQERLGPWVCSGWEGALKDVDAKQRFDRLLQRWGKEGSAPLKVAATGVLRTRQGER
jgi:hypothetical protein